MYHQVRYLLLFGIAIIFCISLASASYYYSNYTWSDEFDDGVVNQTFWNNITFSSAGAGCTVTTANHETIASDGFANLTGVISCGGNTGAYELGLRSRFNIKGNSVRLQFVTNQTTTGSSTNFLDVSNGTSIDDKFSANEDGLTLLTLPNGRYVNYTLIIKADTLNATLYNTTDNKVISSVILQSAADQFIQWRAVGVSAGAARGAIWVYNFTSQSWGVVLNSPTNNSEGISSSIVFNSTINIFNSTLVNATLYIWNSTSIFNQTTNALTNYESQTTTWNLQFNKLNNYKWNVYGCSNAACEWANQNRTFLYGIQVNNVTYEPEVTETEETIITANISYDSSTIGVITAVLYYNNTQYTMTPTLSENSAIFTRTITAPQVPANQNISFYINISATNSISSLTYQTQTYNQTVIASNVYNCTTGTVAMNITFKDEVSQAILGANGSATLTWRLSTGSSLEKSGSFTFNANSIKICISANRTFYTDFFLNYDADGYVPRTYETSNTALTNVTQNINLYLLNDSLSTSFIVFLRDSTYAPVTSAIVEIQRYYPGTNTYSTVESLETNSEGKSIGHFVTEDENYRFKVYQGGTLVYTSVPTKIFCELTPCTVTITLSSSVADTTASLLSELTSTLHYVEATSLISYGFSDTSTNAQGARLYVIDWGFGSSSQNVICNETTSASSGTLTCSLATAGNGTYLARSYVTRGGTEYLDRTLIVQKKSDAVSGIGIDGLFWSAFILLTVVMIGLYRPVIAVLFGVAGVVIISLLGIASIPPITIFAVIVIGAILAWEMKQ